MNGISPRSPPRSPDRKHGVSRLVRDVDFDFTARSSSLSAASVAKGLGGHRADLAVPTLPGWPKLLGTTMEQ